MSNANITNFTIIIPVIVGVMLAVLYDVLQEVFKGFFSQPAIMIPSQFISIDSKVMAGWLTISAGLVLLFIIYRKSLKKSRT